MSLKEKYEWLLKNRKSSVSDSQYQKIITEIYYQGWEDGASDEKIGQAMRETFN